MATDMRDVAQGTPAVAHDHDHDPGPGEGYVLVHSRLPLVPGNAHAFGPFATLADLEQFVVDMAANGDTCHAMALPIFIVPPRG